ncbi:MAG: zf-HC2 domain-containing protein [Treponema sp.]|jgi:predicted anti-sigma-YlaC factor YlaD|nr:zf-HC2 domain-containing protein [Treponema sp.]
MCPDRQILSLYLDGELPSPWKEKMEAHLASCQECRNRLEQYQKLSTVLEKNRVEALPETESKVWNKVISQMPAHSDQAANNHQIWRRSVSLPVPLAAAAAAVFVAVLFLAVQGLQYPSNAPGQGLQSYGIAANMGADEDMFDMSDLNSVLLYLSRQESSDNVVIELPEARSFSSYGEPALLRAVDYQGRSSR